MVGTKVVPQSNGKAQQFLATIIVNLLSILGGIGCGWPSPVIPQLRSNNPPVGEEPMSESQISWVSSLLPIGSLLLIPFSGILVERIGRKKFALLTGLSHSISWSLIIFGHGHISLYAARLLVGTSIAMSIFISPMYISEIASEDIRGVLASLTAFSANCGILIAYVGGAFLSYRAFACVCLLIPMIFFVAFAFMPETPAFLIQRNRQLQARKSLVFFRGNNQILVDRELIRLQSQLNSYERSANRIGFRDLIGDRATRRGLVICFILLGGQQFSGILVILSYAETIFQRAGSSVSPETAPIIVGVIQIFGSYMSTMLMDRAGRRLLILISCIGMAMSHLLIGLFFNLQRNECDLRSFSWLPLVAMSGYIAFYCLGIGPVPYVFTSEVFRQDVSSSASTLCYVFYWIASATATKAFGPMVDHFGFDVCFFALATFCVVCFICSYCLMPETKGLTREDIVDKLEGIDGSCSNKTDSIKA